MIDEITLYPTEERMHGTYIPWLDNNNYQSDSYTPPKTYAYEENVRTIGDTVSKPYSGNGNDGYDVTLNSFELTDSFDGIATDGCGNAADFSHFMDENGNIVENIRTTIKRGDGVNTIDEIISEEVVPMHILKMNVTITNTTDIENDICICPTMFIIEDGEPKEDWVNNKDGYSCFDSLVGYDGQRMWFSLAMDSDQKGGKNHLILAPNESADVQIAFFADDNVRHRLLTAEIREIDGGIRIAASEAGDVKTLFLSADLTEQRLVYGIIQAVFRPFPCPCDLIADHTAIVGNAGRAVGAVIEPEAYVS